jgi:hypothetical protein
MSAVRRLPRILACAVCVAALGSLLPATTLASGTGTSAGDQQYVDPLTTTTSTHSSTTSAPAAPAPSSAPAASSASSGATTGTAPTSTTAGAQTAPAAHAATLPYTGLDIGACVAVGVAMLGGGFLLRRTVRRTW